MNKVKIPFMPERPILAQAYIPFQQWPEKLYGLDKGLQEAPYSRTEPALHMV